MQLISGHINDSDATKILDTFDIYAFPVANPATGCHSTTVLNLK